MTTVQIKAAYEEIEDDDYGFEYIEEKDRLHPFRDICGMIYLYKLSGKRGVKGGNIISCASHGQIWYSFDNFKTITKTDVIYLNHCGIFWDDDNESFYSFV